MAASRLTLQLGTTPATPNSGLASIYIASDGDVWVLYDDGSEVNLSAGGSGGSPGGANTQVQFNDSGDFGGDAGFVYDSGTNTATIGALVLTAPLPIASGGTAAVTAAAARISLGLEIGVDVQAYDADLAALAALATAGVLVRTGAGTAATRTITGTSNRLSVADGDGVAGNPTLDISASYVGQASITTVGTISSGVWDGTDIAVTAGGTGASSASAARTNLGVAIGTDVQAYDADLAALAGLSSAGMIARTGAGTAAVRTITGTSNRLSVTNGDGVAGDPTLDISASYVGQASITTVGTISTGVWTGTDIAVADGGTGSSTASGARTNLGVAIGTDVQAFDADLSALAGLSSTGIIARTGSGTAAVRTITAGAGITVSDGDGVAGNPTVAGSTNARSGGVVATIGDGSSVIATGYKGSVYMPYAGTITGWTITSGDNLTGSIVVDVWKDVYANFPPTVSDSIAGTEKPTITAGIAGQDNSLTTWSTLAVAAGDVISLNVDSVSTFTRVELIIQITRS